MLGFAPFYLFPLPVLTLALLFGLCERATKRSGRFLVGFAWGLGCFLGGVSWVYVSLNTFGAMPAPLAALSTFLLCALLALCPGFAGLAAGAIGTSATTRALLSLPASWTVFEWVRGWYFTGFPWLAIGYSQAPASPLAGFAPVLGVYGVSLVTALSAGLLYLAWNMRRSRQALAWIAAFAVLWFGGAGLKAHEWTQPVGEPVSVSLIQGNIPQEMKWREDQVRATLDTYLRLIRSTDSRLVVLPETALPLYLQDVPPDYLAHAWRRTRERTGADVLIGLPEYGAGTDEYFNSVISFGTSPQQMYRKHHLVPFGEFVPLKALFGWFVEAVAIPLLDFSRGALGQRPLAVAGQKVGGEHLLRGSLRRGDHPAVAGGHDAREREQRRMVRRFARARPAPPDQPDARARDRASDAARDQHRHDRGDRPHGPDRGDRRALHRSRRARRRARLQRARHPSCAGAMAPC